MVALLWSGTVATFQEGAAGAWQCALTAGAEMTQGRHYAEFALHPPPPTTPDGQPPHRFLPVRQQGRIARLGVAGLSVDPFMRKGGDLWTAGRSVEGWMLSTWEGCMYHADCRSAWQGQPECDEIRAGDAIGMLLDLQDATLEVFVNGERRGFLAKPGMTMDAPSSAHHGREVARLEGPLRWAADIDAQVSINGPLPPPS